MTFNVEEVLSKLTNAQKSALLSGIDFWHTYPIPEYNVPSIRVSDGPNGIRGTKWFAGVLAACLPCGTALGATWDKKLLNKAGRLLGDECIAKGAHCWLGPTINMQRSALGGRGFESFAEDPHLSGILASEMIQGCESTGIVATVKHFVCNDQEHERRAVDTIVTERALRELYLRPFQIVARDASPGAMMTAYNKVNGVHVSEDPKMLKDVVREEWGWDPLVISDWYGTYSGAAAINAGLDLEMPGKTRHRGPAVEFELSARRIKQSILDQRARRVLQFVNHASRLNLSPIEGERDYPEDRALNREACASSIVVLKNDKNVLPLPKTVKKVALIGSHMKNPSITGGGSASLEPYYSVTLYDAIREKLGPNVEIDYQVGAYAHKMLPLIDRQMSNAAIHFFNQPSSIKNRISVGTEPLYKTNFQLMDYKNPKLNFDLFYASVEADFTPDITGLWEFGLTVCGSGNFYINDELIIDDTTYQRPGTSFFGKGTAEEFGAKHLIAGRVYKLRIDFGSAATSTIKSLGTVSFGGGGARLGACPILDVQDTIESAARAAAKADYAIICTGLNADWEGEGFDRPDMSLPPNIDDLISSVLTAAPNTVIVNQSGTPVSMPWHNQASSIVQAWYGGNETGNGIADVLFGDFNPCAKLPLTWPADIRDTPAYLNFGSTKGRVLYGEDVYLGYKYYDKVGRQPLFPFGHGLSYTAFALSSLAIAAGQQNTVIATLKVKNTGSRAGSEILQLYISAPNSPTQRPVRELHGFDKIFLRPGEERMVRVAVDKYATSFWDESEGKWCSEKGVYVVSVKGSNEEVKAEMAVAKTTYWLGL
ncbi:putative beta-glucosidase H [Bisporella sp. PMI_857]|nr:putative beta-glucosidase H [Bisporella sp. PMI_857]